MDDNALLSVEEMYRVDAAAMSRGVPGIDLMEAAGTAIFDEIVERWESRPVSVLCGPGNNGGDGFVVARLLHAAGWPVTVYLLGDRDRLRGDAATNAERWVGAVHSLDATALDASPLIVDALFGAGLARPIDGVALDIVSKINEAGLTCVAVDMPSGVHGDSGAILGDAPLADLTVTFFRAKPGHLLFPGAARTGEVIVADIGIPQEVLAEIGPQTSINGPVLWSDQLPWPDWQSHKYSRGHVLIAGGETMTGAARLAARGARRVGAGLVTIAAPEGVFSVYAGDSPGTIVRPVRSEADFTDLLEDARRNALVIGPGLGVSQQARKMVLAALRSGKGCVVDADGLSSFAADTDELFNVLGQDHLITPHEGEFPRLFREEGDKLSRARAAARKCGAVILLKGPDTVIAAPGGEAVVDANGSPFLATGGSGDVLAGLAGGLMAQGLRSFDAACAANWILGAAATRHGPGMIAEDIPETLPVVLADLFDLAS